MIKTSSVRIKPSSSSDISDVSFFPGVAVETSIVVVSCGCWVVPPSSGFIGISQIA